MAGKSNSGYRHVVTAQLTNLVCMTAFFAAATFVGAQPQFHLPLNEGTGTNITDSVAGLSGPLGLYLDPVTDVASISADDSPSGVAGDNSLKMQGAGFLIADDSVNRVLDITNGPITMEAWIFLRTASPGSTAWESIARCGGSYKMGLRGRNLAFTLYGKADIFSGRIIPANQWVHVAAVWNPGVGVTFYTNGIANSIANVQTPARPLLDNYLTIASEGPAASTTPRIFPGSIDRVRIHNAALSAGQIDNDALNPKAVYAETVVAYNFDEAALPAQNAASTTLPAVPADQLLLAWTRPTWTSDSPTGNTNDFALEFSALQTGGIIPQSATVLDPLATIALNGTNGNYTVEAWIKVPTNFPSVSRRIIFQYQGTPGITLSLNTDRTLHTTAWGKLDQVSSAPVTNDNAWHHVAVVHEDGVQFRFYIDGVLRDTRAYTLGAGSSTVPRFTIGSGFNGSLAFIGKMDRLRYSSQALTPAQFDFPATPLASLSINRVNNDLVITWPAAVTDFALEASASLTTPQWSVVSHQEISGQNTAVVQATGTNTFYRLRK